MKEFLIIFIIITIYTELWYETGKDKVMQELIETKDELAKTLILLKECEK